MSMVWLLCGYGEHTVFDTLLLLYAYLEGARTMPTLGEACQLLRIGRVTLAKWIQRLEIETTRHEWDWRYQTISPEDVERIAEARRKVPGAAAAARTAHMAPDRPTTRSEGQEAASGGEADRFPILAARKHVQMTRSAPGDGLPDGLVSRSELASQHGIALTTLRRWVEQGKIETDGGMYAGESGRFSIAHPVTRQGQHQFYVLASGRSDFRRCESCPHAVGSDVD